MRNATILPRILALTILVLITALIFQRIRSTPEPYGKSIIDKASSTASGEELQKEGAGAGGGDRDPEVETCGPHVEDESLLMRLSPSSGTYNNVVRCWPSVGGIILAQRVHPVELVFLDLDRFYPTPRYPNATQEDDFCKKLRMVGGKWWSSYQELQWANLYGMRQLWPDEIDVLYLGWPTDKKGVWLLRYENWKAVGGDMGTINNALTMEERCLAIELSGGTFFENPEDSEYRAPLVRGFGNTKQRKPPRVPEDGESWMY